MKEIVIPTAAELLEGLKAHLDDYQVEGWEGRDGEEFYAAACAVAAAVLARGAARIGARLILDAQGSARATGSVTVTWSEATVDAVGLRAGQLICQTPWGVRYYLTEPLERAAGAAAGSVTVGVAAEWTGREGNVEARHLSEWALPTGVDPTSEIAWVDYGETKASGAVFCDMNGPPSAILAAGHEFYNAGLTYLADDTVEYADPAEYDVAVTAEAAGAQYNVALDAGTWTWDTPIAQGTINTVTNESSAVSGGQSDALGRAEFLAGVAAGTITIAGATDATGGADGFLDLIGAGRGLPRTDGESDADYRTRIRTLPDVVSPAAILRAVDAVLAPYGISATMHEPWEYGFAPGVGAPGVHPPARPWSFIVSVPSIAYTGVGFAPSQGAPSVHPIGTADLERAGFYAGLQDLVDQIKGAGIWASVQEDPS